MGVLGAINILLGPSTLGGHLGESRRNLSSGV